MSIRTIAYGPSRITSVTFTCLTARTSQLRVRPVIGLLHGGFWRMPYGRDHIAPIAVDLADRGFAVWILNIAGSERRRRVAGTLQDVGAGIDHLATLAQDGEPIDLDRVTIVGHSAGGHLALWSAPGTWEAAMASSRSA